MQATMLKVQASSAFSRGEFYGSNRSRASERLRLQAQACLIRYMRSSRRAFLKTATLAGTTLAISRHGGFTAEATARKNFLTHQPRMKLGTVTYNLAQDWDVPAIIENC